MLPVWLADRQQDPFLCKRKLGSPRCQSSGLVPADTGIMCRWRQRSHAKGKIKKHTQVLVSMNLRLYHASEL